MPQILYKCLNSMLGRYLKPPPSSTSDFTQLVSFQLVIVWGDEFTGGWCSCQMKIIVIKNGKKLHFKLNAMSCGATSEGRGM